MSKLFDIFQEGTERVATSMINGRTMMVMQYQNSVLPDESSFHTFWVYGFEDLRHEPEGMTLTFDRRELENELFCKGYDPLQDAWDWYHPQDCHCDQCCQGRS